MKHRCPWPGDDPLMVAYHDEEWGVPLFDDRKLFEFLVLESAQAGLSWKTVLHKRANYRKAFAEFDPVIVAGFDDNDRQRLLQDKGIIRNKAKIEAAIKNAGRFLDIAALHGSFANYIWNFVGGTTIVNYFKELNELPSNTPLSDSLAKDLKSRGFSFLGSTVVYAHMQATGMVNDHLVTCFRHRECQES